MTTVADAKPRAGANGAPRERASREASAIAVELRGEVAVIHFDVPGESVNTLRADFVDAFAEAIEEVDGHPDVRAAVLVSGKKDSFIVGADVNMLASIASVDDGVALVRRGHDVLARLGACAKPVVAAVHGPALGGGFEVALACHGRVASSSDKTAFGFPEVQLGLLPGANGLQRLAALAGLQVALDYGLTGKNMRAKKALELGFADDVVHPAILEATAIARALALAEDRAAGRSKRARKLDVATLALEKNPLGRSLLFKKAREEARKKTGGHYPAPEKIVAVLESYAKDGFARSQEVEARAFAELLLGDVSVNLRSIFFATTALKKDSGVTPSSGVAPDGAPLPEVRAREVGKIGVLGAGLMGAGIAYVSLDKGVAVRMKDRDAAAVGRGLGAIDGILAERVKKRQLAPRDKAQKLALVSGTTDYSGMKGVELVIEAVFEDLAVKQRVLREVEEACRADVIFASNTSSIPIARIAEGARHPENVVGMHYFSPVHKMPLLEVIRTRQTADAVVATAVAVGKRQGKTVIVVNDGVGFYTSRALGPYMNEASYLLSEGVPIEAIDQAMVAWGWPVGPLMLVDEVGIDVAAHVGPIMLAAFGERLAPPPTIARLVDDGRKGKKNDKGFYRYGAAAKQGALGVGGKKGKQVDETVYAALGLAVPKKSPVAAAEIQERCNLQMVNEALRCFGEGILRSARDGDIGAIFGLGFPPFRGGPFRWVDSLGAARVLDRVRHYRDRFGRRFEPAPALVDYAKSGKRFHG